LHYPVTWYKIADAGEQVAQWNFQNKGRFRWTGKSCIALEVPLRNLLISKAYLLNNGRTIRKVMGGVEKKIHASENAKKKNSFKEEGKEKNSSRRKVQLCLLFNI